MPHFLKNPQSFVGKPKAGDGDCVDLVRVNVETLVERPTVTWKAGKKVIETKDLKPGTVIATMLGGGYPQAGTTGKHVAVFLRYWGKPNPDGTYNSILVLDQWKSRPTIAQRELRRKGNVSHTCCGGVWDASNNLDAFYVVE